MLRDRTAPQLEDFASSIDMDPSKPASAKSTKAKGKGKAKAQAQAAEINLTPMLDQPSGTASTASFAPVPRKAAGFKPITKRTASEDVNGNDAKRARIGED